MSSLLASLFQPNKGHLSPAGRAFVSWLEIMILGIIVSLVDVGLNYTNGHPGDYSGLLHVMVATLVISLLKAFAGLSIPRVTPQTPQPVSQQPVVTPAPQAQQEVTQSPVVPPFQFTTSVPQPSYATSLPTISMPMAAMPLPQGTADQSQFYNLATQSVQAVPGQSTGQSG